MSATLLDLAAVRARFTALDRRLAFFDGPGGGHVEQCGAHWTLQVYDGLAVSEAPTKQSRSPFASSSATAVSSGLGSKTTSASNVTSTNANRPSSSRRVTVPRAEAVAVSRTFARTQW